MKQKIAKILSVLVFVVASVGIFAALFGGWVAYRFNHDEARAIVWGALSFACAGIAYMAALPSKPLSVREATAAWLKSKT